MSEIRSWADTPAAQIRAALGAAEPELRSMDEVHAWHRRVPVIEVPDTRSPIEIAAARTRAAQQTQVKFYTHDELQAMAAQQYARGTVLGVIRPGGESGGLPHWNAEKGQGTPWRMVAFGPGTEQRAVDIMAAWQAEDLAHEKAVKDELGKRGIGF